MLAAWIDAALDRETPFKCTAGLHGALRHRDATTGFEHHGFLNVLVATRARLRRRLARRRGRASSSSPTKAALARAAFDTELAGARRWFTSFGSCSVTEPLDELIALGLLERVTT